MRLEIDLREQRLLSWTDRITERLLSTALWVGDGLQGNPHVRLADLPRGILQALVELVRSGRLTEVEPSGAYLNGDSELRTRSRNIAGEERARDCGGAKDGPGTHAS